MTGVFRAAVWIYLTVELLCLLLAIPQWIMPSSDPYNPSPNTAHWLIAMFHFAVALSAEAAVGAAIFLGARRLTKERGYARAIGLIVAFPVGAVVGVTVGIAVYPLWEAFSPWPQAPEMYQVVFGGAFWGAVMAMPFGAGLGQSLHSRSADTTSSYEGGRTQ